MARKRLAAFVLVACLGVAGCGSSGTVSGAPSAPSSTGGADQAATTSDPGAVAASSSESDALPVATDPCKLVTKAEAQKLIGTALQDAVEAGQGTDAPSCTYSGPTSGPTAQVEVHTGDGAKKYYDLQRGPLAHQLQAESGIGDEAWIDKDDMSIFVRKGDGWFVIHLVSLDDVEKFLPGLRTAAKAAVARI
ncbi:hypothetical protein GCM10009839_18020 [Catenulispora yoronensis]|uniref:DUF3558 domain-containing protein n=1 Tax=Catenulispora yoronensis TaxID=450799 RepID=A0ABP5FBL8_9ACTN